MSKKRREENKMASGNKIAQGNAAQLLVASELNRRGWSAAVTLGNTPHVDVLCSNPPLDFLSTCIYISRNRMYDGIRNTH